MTHIRKFGRKPVKIDHRTLKLEKYLSPSLVAPEKVTWDNKISNWGMMLNDQIGDCTCAGVGHFIMNWTANAGNLITPTDEQVLDLYKAVGNYNPDAPLDTNGDNPTDNGAIELDVLKYWQLNGFIGHKIGAFVSINPQNINHLKLAIYLFGGIYTGVQLTQDDMDNNNAGNVWIASTNNSYIGGHAIPAFSYDFNNINFVTWGAIQPASYAWVEKQMEECYAIVSQDWIENTGKSPSGFDIDTLIADLKAVKN